MDFGFPVIYNCPSCGKKMQMQTYTSYTVSSSKYFSDGNVKESGICCAHFTPELAKCPGCYALFFRGNAKNTQASFITDTSKIKDILEPGRDDLINAVKNNFAKDWQEEKTLREMLWHDINEETRQGYNVLCGDELKIWQDNCAALLPLFKKSLKEMRLKKNNEKYNNSDREDCLLMIAELYRNLGKFEKCMELLNELDNRWSWMKKQFAWECKAKNIFTFELMSKNEMNLEKAKEHYAEDYYKRAQKFLPLHYGRRNLKKVIAGYKRAESLGKRGITFYRERGDIYLDELNDPDSAIADFTRALKQKDKDEWLTRYISAILCQRSAAYLKKGNIKKAFADIQKAIDDDIDNDWLYAARSVIYETMGDIKAAEKDKRKAEMLRQENLELLKKQQEEWEALINKPVKISSKKGIKNKRTKNKRNKMIEL